MSYYLIWDAFLFIPEVVSQKAVHLLDKILDYLKSLLRDKHFYMYNYDYIHLFDNYSR